MKFAWFMTACRHWKPPMQCPEVVLLDIGLPQMDGYEVAQRLRQQPGFQETVLVALTGYGTDEDRLAIDRSRIRPPPCQAGFPGDPATGPCVPETGAVESVLTRP